MSLQSNFPFVPEFLRQTSVILEVSKARFGSDAGLLLVRQTVAWGFH